MIVALGAAIALAHLDAISVERLQELLVDAWLMCVPKRVGAAYLAERTG